MTKEKEKTLLVVPNEGIMVLFIEGHRASLVHIPIFSDGDTEAVVTYTFGEPGVDESFDDIVPIQYKA